MSKITDTLVYLIPNGGWTISNDDFDTIIYDEGVEPITRKQFDDALQIIDKVNADKELAKTTAKVALLNRLGITAEEAALLLS